MKGPAGLLCDLTSHPFSSTPVISAQISLEHYSVFGLKASHGLPSLLIPTGPRSGLQSPNSSDHSHAVVSFIFISSRDLLLKQQADASTSLLEISAWKPVRQFTSIRKPPLTPRRAMEAPPLPIILGLPLPASALYPQRTCIVLWFICLRMSPRDGEHVGEGATSDLFLPS